MDMLVPEGGKRETCVPVHHGCVCTAGCAGCLLWGIADTSQLNTLLLIPCSPLYSNLDCWCVKPLFTLSNCVFLLVKNYSINYPTRKTLGIMLILFQVQMILVVSDQSSNLELQRTSFLKK